MFSNLGVAYAQKNIDETLERYNSGSIAYIKIDELKSKLDNNEELILLDTRSKEEYEVSHFKNALWIGYKSFNAEKVNNFDRSTEIILYCSVGVRSEKIGEELKDLGFENIRNLYGGIFLWVNNGFPVYVDGKETDNIHTYNKRWEQFIERGKKVN
jgi:rhodanese-related sulfurtransferase